MRYVFLIFVAAFTFGNLSAMEGFFVGLGTEINANAPRGPGVSASFIFGADLNPHWAVGAKAAYNPNVYVSGTLEPSLLARYYLTSGSNGPFAQAELGCVIIFAVDNDYLGFSGGVVTGWRFDLSKSVYLEPALRFGYPYLMGLGVMAGFRQK